MYEESEMQRKKEKEHKRREQKRRASQMFAVAEARPDPLDCGADQLRKAQAEDTTLKGVWKNLHNGDLGYVLHNDILYRKCRKDEKWTDEEEALVLPKAYRNRVLEASHSAVYAGHLERDNTLAKIKRLYYWPGMATAVRRMCRSCPTCQKATRRKRSRKVPLCLLPIIDKPFRRIGMDLIGPLPRTKTGYRHVLVIVDYGTRFPEAIPLKKMDTDTIIDALIPFFGRVGFPEVLTDRGTNFTSKLMKDFQKMV